jgi:hypothetical protein
MNVALDGDHDFLAREGLELVLALRRLRFVPVLIQRGQRMDVVIGGIAVLNLNVLPGHDANHVGNIHAPVLVDHDGIRGHSPIFFGQMLTVIMHI